jgi:tight adherence protein B
MPLLDCLRIVATEGEEPLKSEFQLIMDKQGFGLTVPQAIETLYERVPTPEVNFFSIVIGVQQKAGGNLSEALSNLSKVLRDRKKLRQKVDAMSSEAKASAGIIAAMPFFVGFMTYLSSPAYISLLWTHPTGRFFMGFCAFWMICGVLIMKKMINFKI